MSTQNNDQPTRRRIIPMNGAKPPAAPRGAELEDLDDDEGQIPHAPERAAAMFPILCDCWGEICADPTGPAKIARLDDLLSKYGNAIHRFRVVLYKMAAVDGSTKRTWCVVESFDNHRDASIAKVRAAFGSGMYKAHLFGVLPDENGLDKHTDVLIGFGFNILSAEAPEPRATPPAVAPPSVASPIGLGLSPLPVGGGSLADQIALMQATAQIELARQAAERQRLADEEARAARQRQQQLDDDERRERAEERRQAREDREEERRERAEERRRDRERAEEERREREEDRRDRRARDLEQRLLEMREKQVTGQTSPLELLKSQKEAIAQARELFGEGGKDTKSGALGSVLEMLGEAFGKHSGKIVEIAGKWMENNQVIANNQQRLEMLELQANAAIAAEHQRQNPPRVARPAEPAPEAPRPAQHIDPGIKVEPATPVVPDLPVEEPATAASVEDSGGAPSPSVAGAPPADESLPAAAANSGEQAGALLLDPNRPLSAEERAALVLPDDDEDDDDGDEDDDEDGCPTCDPCPHNDGHSAAERCLHPACHEECTCPRCPHGYAEEGDDEQ